MTSATLSVSTDVSGAPVQFDASPFAKRGLYVVEVLENFRWMQITPKDERHTSVLAAMTAAQALVDPRVFDPTVEQLHTAVRIVRVGRFTNDRLEITPEVGVQPLFLEVLMDGGNPDLSPAKDSDPLRPGETGWVGVSDAHDAFSPAALVARANRLVGEGHAHAARIRRGLSYDSALTVWTSKLTA